MSDRPEKRKVEFIESYWTGGEYGSDYKWNDNHGELIRCKDCKHGRKHNVVIIECMKAHDYNPEHQEFHNKNWFCADGESG